ncbi:hypothetical protein ACFQ9Y_10760 [Peribacillus simplex]
MSNWIGQYCETGLRAGDLAPTNHAIDPGIISNLLSPYDTRSYFYER